MIAWLGFVVSVLVLSASLAQAAQNTVTLGWDAVADASVAGYRLHYGTAQASYDQAIDVGNLTTATVSNLQGGNTYYFVVTAVDGSGSESLPSNEVSFAAAADPLPVVSLANPGSMINGPATITLNASASVTGGGITRVEFYVGAIKLGEAQSSPQNSTYTTVWNNVQPGSYDLSAVAYDSNGHSATSAPVSITIAPFGVTQLGLLSDGSCQLTTVGAPGSRYNVYASEDLLNWRLLQTVANTNGTVVISDNTASQVPRRFYKLTVSTDARVSGAKTDARGRR